MILITGGCGFIGANYIIYSLNKSKEPLVNLDKLTYAANKKNLSEVANQDNYFFEKGSIDNLSLVTSLLNKYQPRLVINFAAESHVDRSIKKPRAFLESNTIGTYNLLESSRNYWEKLSLFKKENFRFIHISTDEVFGSLKKTGKFSENSPYNPSSPYSASKAASDHFVSAWYKTYGFPSIITNCSNNYGPRQFPEKLIPLTIKKILDNKKIPIFGDGNNIRNWLFVEDHIDAIILIALRGTIGKKYCIGAEKEVSNLDLVKIICKKIDNKTFREQKSEALIDFVEDRLGHDFRYSIDSSMLKKELGWTAQTDLEIGLEKTINWYLENIDWLNLKERF